MTKNIVKSFLLFPLFAICYLLFTVTSVFAENKCGVNIGPKYSQINQAANLTKPGGWTASLGSPGNCSNFESLFGRNQNIVIRTYNGGKAFTNPQALGWVATLGKMDTKGQMIYLMPWNEPNHTNEGGGSSAGNQVYQYSQYLRNTLAEAGLLGTKVIFLSPMVDKLNPSFINSSFFTNPGGKAGFYNMFDGSSINEYDQFSPGPCSSSVKEQNNCLYDQVGISIPYFALESGVAGTCTPPCYHDHQLHQMLDRSWQKWSTDPNFKMFAIFSYDPHRAGSWNIFNSSQVKGFYQGTCQTGGLTSSSFDPTVKFDAWFSQNQGQLVSCGGCGYAPSSQYCTPAGEEVAEAETLSLENSSLCTDFSVNYKKTSEQTQEITPTPTSGSMTPESLRSQGLPIGSLTNLSGRLRLEQIDFPNLQPVKEILVTALQRALPLQKQWEVSLPYNQIESKVEHQVRGTDESGNPLPSDPSQKIPKTKFMQPGWFSELLGVSKIFCGLMNTCEAPKKLALKIEQPNIDSLPVSFNTGCNLGQNTQGEALADISHPQEEFTVKSWWEKTIDIIEDIIGSIIRIITRTTEKTALNVKTRGYVVGGPNLEENSSLFAALLPQNVLSSKTGALEEKGTYALPDNIQAGLSLSEAGGNPNEKTLKYQRLASVRRNHCLQQSAILPSNVDISSVSEICHSRIPADYPLTSSSSNLPVPPQACSADKPYEIIPACTICQNILFCYGNNYRLCPADSKIPVPALGSRNDHWWFSPGEFSTGSVLYNSIDYPVPAGGVYVCDSNVYGCANERCH